MIAGTALFQHLREYRAIAFHGLDEFDQKTSSEAERHLDGQDSGFAPVTMSFFEAHFADIERPRPHDRRPLLYGLIHVISDMAKLYDRSGGDRKNVVEGKCVSVRVDLGGRRSSKKNRNTQ